MQTNRIRVAITGAAGQIGYALLFRLLSGNLFGQNTRVELRLLELEQAMSALNGVGMELWDSAFPNLESLTLTSDPKEAFLDADWVLLVGSVPRKAGMERKDLLTINANIFIEQGRAIEEVAADNANILVVGNPCNTNAYLAKSQARRIPSENFFAMTMLDQTRAAHQLASKSGVPSREVKQVGIWGNHSATQFPDFAHATAGGNNITDLIGDKNWLQGEFIDTVQQRGAAIIKARGLSSAASAASAVVKTIECLTTPTPKDDWFSVAVGSRGEYGIPEGIMFSYPIRSDGRHWKVVDGLEHDEFAEGKIRATTQELLEEQAAVKGLLESRVR